MGQKVGATVVVGPVLVSVVEALPETGRTGAMGVTLRWEVVLDVGGEEVDVDVVEVTWVSVDVEIEVDSLVLLLLVVLLDEVTVGLTITVAVDAASHPAPAHR